MKNSFIIYNDYEDWFDMLPSKEQGKLIKAMFATSKGKDVSAIEKSMEKTTQMAWISIKKDMQKDALKYQEKCDKLRQNGAKGGLAKAENNSADESSSKCYQMLVNASNCPQIESDNDNVNDLVSLLVNNKNNNKKIDINKQCGRACEDFQSREEFINAFDGIRRWFAFHTSDLDVFKEFGVRVVNAMILAYGKSIEKEFRFAYKKWSPGEILETYQNLDSERFGKIVSQLKFHKEIENETLYIWGCLFN